MKKVPIFVTERMILSVRLKRLITLLSHSAVICFQVQQGSLCSTLTSHVELWVCVCNGEGGGGVGGTPTITADVFQDGKPLVSCVRERREYYSQQQRLHGTYRRSSSRESTGDENGRWGRDAGGRYSMRRSTYRRR